MIDRYTTPEMKHIWSEENKYTNWLTVELLALEAYAKLGKVPAEDLAFVKANAKLDIPRLHVIEAETRHDVVAFTRSIAEKLGEQGKWIHYGLTSTDVVDTALAISFKQANTVLKTALLGLQSALAVQAKAHKNTLMMGRTHGIHAEPTTFGLKMALFYEEMSRHLIRFEAAASQVEVGKLSGSVGTFANISPFVEFYVCEKLGIPQDPVSTQTLQRDRHAHYLSTLALIASSLEKFAIEIRHLQRTEVGEVSEGFKKGQTGSSSMPHKKNPIGSENITGLARVIRGHMVTAYENIPLWHERDISHSSAERIIFPDSTTLLHYMLLRLTGIIENLNIHADVMLRNMNQTKGLVFSQQLLHRLIDTGMTRETAYGLVQPLALKAHGEGLDFKALVHEDPQITAQLSKDDIDGAFDPAFHLKEIDTIYQRVGLDKLS